MKRLIFILISIFPPFIAKKIRKLLGVSIGIDVKIGFGVILIGNNIIIEDGVQISPFSIIIAETINIAEKSSIKSFSLIKVNNLQLGKYVKIRSFAIVNSGVGVESELVLGDHSSIFPFCWLEPTEGIYIGKQVGIGGHTLIFTHGSWSNYLKGGPVQFGSVHIEDNVWLPWRNFIMPGVRIGRGSIISANSVVNKNIPPNSLAGGTPAKVIKQDFIQELSYAKRLERMIQIVESYYEKSGVRKNANFNIIISNSNKAVEGSLLLILDENNTKQDCLVLTKKNISVYSYSLNTFFVVTSNKKEVLSFMNFVSIYGIRPYVENV